MQTVNKVGIPVGDRRAALAVARYALEFADSPQAFQVAAADGDDSQGELQLRANAIWAGTERTLRELGLERGAEVQVGELASALEGRHVATRKQKRKPGTRRARRNGVELHDSQGKPLKEAVVNSFELTFNAPKSVSVVWALAGPELRAEIEQAMLAAANAMVEHLIRTRSVIQGADEPAEGFAASLALHVTARTAQGESVPSPHLHVHGHLVAVQGRTGGIKTPDGEALFKRSAPREGGAVGRLHLAETLRRIGLPIQWGTGRNRRFFEIDRVPEGLRDRMSGRTRDVEAGAREREAKVGRPLSPAERAVVAKETRAEKDRHQSHREVERTWRGHGEDFFFEQPEQLLGGHVEQASVEELQATLRKEIHERMWAEGPTMSIEALGCVSLELAPMGLSREQAVAVLGEMQRDGELITLEDQESPGPRRWVTTRAIREREQFVMQVAVDAASEPKRALSARARQHGIEVVERELGPGKSLDREQVDAIELLTGGAGWVCLTGLAGTGKGKVLRAVAEAHRADGWRVIGCAVDGANKEQLGDQIASEDALTIEQLLYNWRKGDLYIDEETLILIDEASKPGTRDHWNGVAELRKATRARVIPVGDIGQLGAIECPGMFQEMLEHEAIESARLKEVRRHRDPADPTELHPWLITYQKLLYEGKVEAAEKAIALLDSKGALNIHRTREEAMRGLVDKWAERRDQHGIAARDAILLVHGSNDDIDHVNELAQEKRLRAGELVGDGVKAPDRNYRLYENDVVMLREGSYNPEDGRPGAGKRVENGTIGIVREVDASAKRIVVAFNQPGDKPPRLVEIDLAKLEREAGKGVAAVRLLYAGHPFPIQGATYKYVGSLWGHFSQGKEATYSGDTRVEFYLDVHTDDESLGWDGSRADRLKRLGKRIATSWNRRASIHYTPREAQIAPRLTALRDLPQVPTRDADRTREHIAEMRRQERARAESTSPVADPLEAYRELLGQRRTEAISRRADAHAPDMSKLSEDALLAAREPGREALANLDRRAAWETLRLETEQPLVSAGIDYAVQQAKALKAMAKQLSRLRDRQERDDLLQSAQSHRATAKQDQARLGRLLEEEGKLTAEGRHPNQWVERHGDAFARAIAAERQLVRRTDRHIQHLTEQAIDDPPDYVQDLIGAAPARDEAHRREWEELVAELVRENAATGAAPPLERQPGGRDSTLRGRIDRLRDLQGLPADLKEHVAEQHDARAVDV